jgi:predicted TIM-barrel fold metal-dependent hydrolase
MKLPYPAVDSDSHYYETYDCFTRHIESRFADRAVRPDHRSDGIARVHQGDRRLAFQPNWPIDLAGEPGSLMDYFLGQVQRDKLIGEPIDAKNFPAFYQRTARLKLMDAQGIGSVIMLPTLAVSVENDLRGDVDALYANVRSVNRWIEEEWGFGYHGRIFSTAALSLVDPGQAAAELRRVLDLGARTVYLAPGPLYGRSPADTAYDPFWGLLNEAQIPVIFHIGDCLGRYAELYSPLWGEQAHPPLHRFSAFQAYCASGDRAIMDTLAALILHNLFGRFSSLQVMAIELGSSWVSPLLTLMEKAHRDTFGRPSRYGTLTARPTELFLNHVSVTPFFEEDVRELISVLGIDRVLFGSDFPHPEGVREPLQFTDKLAGLDGESVYKVMRGNTARLLRLPGEPMTPEQVPASEQRRPACG